jgi:hypothetical protein
MMKFPNVNFPAIGQNKLREQSSNIFGARFLALFDRVIPESSTAD